MTSEPAKKRLPLWTRVRHAIFGKPLTHEQMQGMTASEVAAQRVDPAARASQTSHSTQPWLGGGI
ncbi:MAG: hypothetical protein ABWY55_02425 [Microbacterium sp.]